MKQYYECHITMIGKPTVIRKSLKESGWKFSKIDGDPDLGKGVKCYATRQFNIKFKVEFILDVLVETALELAKNSGCRILRKKIEVVIYDNRDSLR